MRFRFWKMFNFANAMHLVTLFLLASKNKYHSSDKWDNAIVRENAPKCADEKKKKHETRVPRGA